MITKSWEEFFNRLDEIEFANFDLIVAVARGGIIPASFIQQKLNIPMEIIKVNFRDDGHQAQFNNAKLLEKSNFAHKGVNILLVDDVLRTGSSIEVAKKYLDGNIIKTCIINGEGDYSFFQSKECINMPWKR